MRALAGQLQEIAKQTEPDFVSLADELESLHSSSQRIGSGIQASASAVGNLLQERTLYGPQGVGVRLSRHIQAEFEQAEAERDSLFLVDNALRSLQNHAAAVEDVTRGMSASVAGFAIESSRSAACQQAFGTYVEELRTIVDRIHHLGEAMSDRAAATRRELSGLLATLNGDLTSMRGMASACESAVERTEGRVHSFFASSSATLAQSQAHAELLSSNAAEAVYHLQFGDIVRQKLEHVASALNEAAAMPDGSSLAVDQIIAVQSGQLELVSAEITTACSNLAAAFGAVAAQTHELVKSAGATSSTEGGGTPLQACQDLSENLTGLALLQSKSHLLRNRAHQAYESAAEASAHVSGLLREVEEINHDMHLQALNAIVATELLAADGRTLGVLSMYLHQSYQQLNQVVSLIAAAMGEVNHHTEVARSSAPDSMATDAEISAGIEGITRMQTEFLEANNAIALLIDGQQVQIDRAKDGFSFLSDLTSQLLGVFQELSRLRPSPGSLRMVGANAATLMSMNGRYTMESERMIHRRITAPAGNADEASASSASTNSFTSSGDRFGENVELF